MLDEVSYPLAVAKARLELTEAPVTAGPRRTRKQGLSWFTIDEDVALYFTNENLYIRGFRTGDVGFHFRNVDGFAIATGKVEKLSYDDDYKSLGWNRQVPITVTVDDVDQALENLRHARPGKEPEPKSMLRMAIAFAEAVRFDRVVTKIRAGAPIEPADVSWDPGPLTRVLRHDQ